MMLVSSLLAASFAAAAPSDAYPLVLAEDGKSAYAISLCEGASPSERHAAEELRRFLAEISGAEIPVAAPDSPPGPRIVLGGGAEAKALGLDVEGEKLGEEGYVIRTVPPHLIIAGGRLRGTMYGVYSFLEDELGCRWFTPDCARIPKERSIRIWRIDRRFVPRLEYRATDYPNSRDADWCARNKVNGHLAGCDEARGGRVVYHHFVHTFNGIIDPQKEFDAHPEYFSMIDGKRVKHPTQLCLTNPEVLRIAKEVVRRWIREAPEATIHSVSQNDWHNYCRCPSCAAVAQEEKSQAGPLIRFLNAIGEDIEKDHPDKALDTLAYQYTRKPPAIVRPRPNVIVRLCSIECCFSHPLATDPFNASFVEDIRGWSKICDRLYIWDYIINYAHSIMPFPNLYSLRPNIRFFVDHGVRGIYEEANYYSKGGEFAELRTWIVAKTLWDPDYDTGKAIHEFLEGYYGRAARALGRYIAHLHDPVIEKGIHWRIFDAPNREPFSPDWIARAEALFDEAEAAVAGDPVLAHRVAVARLPLAYVRIVQGIKPERFPGDRAALDPEGRAALIDRFEAVARVEGVTQIREGGGGSLAEWLAEIRK